LLIGAGAPLAVRVDSAGRLNGEGNPLIPGVDDLTEVVIKGLDEAQSKIAVDIREGCGGKANIEAVLSRVRLLEQAIGSATFKDLSGEGFGDLAKAMCQKIGSIVGVDLPAGASAYTELIAWISGTLRQHPVEIFTTNYDLLFEEAFERGSAPYFDGFSGGANPFFDPVTVAGDDLPARWSRLWKLHGSLGWKIRNGRVIRSGGKAATELVYPDYLKYDLTQKQPYAALFERLKQFLLTPDTLLIAIGFSFRDAHVCAVLEEALAMNANAALFAFQYNQLVSEEPATRLASSRPNLSVYAADGAVINGIPGRWSPGEMPKNWAEIRASFWQARGNQVECSFVLGDFVPFARFCALAQAKELTQSPAQETETPSTFGESTEVASAFEGGHP
jgi:hypothetical protein